MKNAGLLIALVAGVWLLSKTAKNTSQVVAGGNKAGILQITIPDYYQNKAAAEDYIAKYVPIEYLRSQGYTDDQIASYALSSAQQTQFDALGYIDLIAPTATQSTKDQMAQTMMYYTGF